MAGVLNFAPSPIFQQFPTRRIPKTRVSIRSSSEFSETPPNSASVSTKEQPNLGFSPPPNFKPPQPKPFSVRPDKIRDILGAALALFFRLGTGVFASGYQFTLSLSLGISILVWYSVSFVAKNEVPSDKYALEIAGFKVKETSKLGPRPEKPIEIYEFERFVLIMDIKSILNIAFVREIVAVLDLDVLYYPCPKNGPNFRQKVAQMGGKKQFPYMVDPNTGVAMYESDDIIKYLVGKYDEGDVTNIFCFFFHSFNTSVPVSLNLEFLCVGDGNVPIMLSLGLLTTLTEGFAMIGRMGKGGSFTPSKLPPEPLEIWAYEGSPFCKVVREVLVELELPHLLHSCARGSPKRQILYEKTGHFQVPYLEDPNTGVQMFESAEIAEYLRATYAL
ncbi:hypothetical protein TEA_018336 [Camellia sinensis var. sinensis]|uniref:GST N-terminal domain-containing protein n=1 Tax=Camellia sinensis var. sinensis TaxID=542762 RepID=A0A4V3WPQ8_CAMSN|nr:hypothetical protein TEA_018336 [Camellia sinensis var. sinensis]